MNRLYESPARVFAVFLLVFSVWQMVWPDLMPYHHGFGFEGHDIFKPFAKDALRYLAEQRLSSYHVQRILPYTLLYVTFRAFSIPFGDAQMIGFFQVLQLGLGLIIIWYWHRLATLLQLGRPAQWLGYAGLLLNFATLKHDMYIPFTYDRMALASGMAGLYYYFADKRLALLINAVLALMVWPSAMSYNLLLLLFPVDLMIDWRPNRLLDNLRALGTALFFVGVFSFVAYHGMDRLTLAPVVKPLLPLSITLAGLYLLATQSAAAAGFFPAWSQAVYAVLRVLRPHIGFLYVGVLVASFLLLTRLLGDPKAVTGLTPTKYLINVTYGAVQRPLQFLVAHAVYHGLAYVLLIVRWKQALRILTQLSLGLRLTVLAVLLQSINSETRQLANVLPVLVLLAALMVDEVALRRVDVYLLTGLAFLFSKGWVMMSWFSGPGSGATADFPLDFSRPDYAYFTWPGQLFWMNLGPWIATPYLVGQAVVLAGLGYLIHRQFRRAEAGRVASSE